MTKVFSVCVLSLMTAAPAVAQSAQRKSCEDLKSEIAAKLDAKGVKGYQLDIVAAAEAGEQQVVGTCDGGAKKITYKRDGDAKSSNAK